MRFIGAVPFTVSALLLILLMSCQNSEPIRIGFVGGLSGRVADLGVSCRNGVQLAVEQRNAAGGINGQPVELVVMDDGQNPDTARRAVAELIGQGIELIVGPMTSSIAMAVIPQVNASKCILLSPTVTTTELNNKDDNFLRVISSTSDYASKSARYLYEKLGGRTAAVIYDISNRSYTESWLKDFRKAFTALGGRIVLARPFQSDKATVFQAPVQEMLSTKADTVVIVSNAVDSALICQQVRKLDPRKRIVMSEWASTERFTELAGTASEGVVVAQFLDRNDTSQRYRDFLSEYSARFGQDPGFAGVAGYDAAQIALDAYVYRKQGESLKTTIIAKGTFLGVQQQLTIDRFGDADRKTFVSVIRGSRYITVE